ncbi:hypothetical protein DPMN_093277 [Dreissena polymorpha]|uniref:Uncharacterized protein n=1 Tax=Dreissena polymorpha TaxID=45954 RepID=A0A9D4L3V4_DREPO|nr:hypothetical protein DPMN_093277 [Dreissena polymorpha]
MSDIVEFALRLLEEDEVLTSTFLNRDMKQLIISHNGHSVTISPNSRVNESDIIFSSDISANDIVIKLKNQDIMQEAGTQLRKVLKDVDFGLQVFATVLTSSLQGKEQEFQDRFSRFCQLFLRSLSTSFFKAVRMTLRSFYSLLKMRYMRRQRNSYYTVLYQHRQILLHKNKQKTG